MTTITTREQQIRFKAAQMSRTLPIPADIIAADLRLRMVCVSEAHLEQCLEAAAAEVEAKYWRAMERNEAIRTVAQPVQPTPAASSKLIPARCAATLYLTLSLCTTLRHTWL